MAACGRKKKENDNLKQGVDCAFRAKARGASSFVAEYYSKVCPQSKGLPSALTRERLLFFHIPDSTKHESRLLKAVCLLPIPITPVIHGFTFKR